MATRPSLFVQVSNHVNSIFMNRKMLVSTRKISGKMLSLVTLRQASTLSDTLTVLFLRDPERLILKSRRMSSRSLEAGPTFFLLNQISRAIWCHQPRLRIQVQMNSEAMSTCSLLQLSWDKPLDLWDQILPRELICCKEQLPWSMINQWRITIFPQLDLRLSKDALAALAWVTPSQTPTQPWAETWWWPKIPISHKSSLTQPKKGKNSGRQRPKWIGSSLRTKGLRFSEQ